MGGRRKPTSSAPSSLRPAEYADLIRQGFFCVYYRISVMLVIILVLVIAIVLISYFSRCFCGVLRESFGGCKCDPGDYHTPKIEFPILNQFVYPCSATSCADDLYLLQKDSNFGMRFNQGPLTTLNTTDHVELI
jgi:hypothetical protein